MLRYFWPSDDEQLAGQWHDSHFDEDAGWWVGVCQAGATFALATVLSLASSSTATATSVFSQSQDDPAGSLTTQTPTQEEYALPLVAPLNWPQTSIFVDDDVHPTFVQVFSPDDGDWKNLVPPVPSSNYISPLWFLDPKDLPQFPALTPVDEDTAVGGPLFPQFDTNWTLLFFLDDGSAVPIFQPDEDLLPSQALPQPFNWPQPSQPFSSSDEDQLVIQFVAAEDPVWLQLVAPVPSGFALLQPFFFDQNEPANLVAFTDEVYQQPLVAPDPGNIFVFPQWPFETNDPAGSLTLILDDAFRPDFVPPVPASFIWPQPWVFDQNEPLGFLVAFHDEDFWTPQVPSTNWPQPSVFIADDFLVPQSTTTIDELYWNLLTGPITFAIPPSMQVAFPYVPDPEMIPAGSLVGPPPVVPCFMPLPPSGPDKDVAISTFSNFKGGPVLALFCRICNSGLPLVVRGDYAIWCQDCCAFVSKQDTYMGTVRSPGQFRGRF